MPEETKVAGPSKVKYAGVFDLKGFYKLLYDILAVTLKYTVEEEKYKEKVDSGGKLLEIRWRAEKKVDDYTLFIIEVNIFITGLTPVTVERDGVETKANKGDIEVTFKCKLQTDYEGRWESSPILKFLKGVYDTYLYRSTFENWKKKIYEEMYTAQNEIKAFFNLSRFM